jgi:squalene-hopene/tetraprenyl-beta-curcumene cyclase
MLIANKDDGERRRAAVTISGPSPSFRDPTPAEALDDALASTRERLLEDQQPDGHWVGELEGDTILESEYVLLMAYLGRGGDEACVKACKFLFEKRRPEGGWSIYPGGPFDLSASVKAYFALKIVGMSPEHPEMARTRALILEAGGARASNSFTRFYLALLGQLGYDECPSVPPELALLPSWLNFSLNAMSAWTRTIVVPLAIWSAFKPVRHLPAELGIAELLPADLPSPSRRTRGLFTWTNFFLGVDRALKLADRVLPAALRRPGIRAAHRWMLERFEGSDGLGAISPPMFSTVISLGCLGYEPGSPLVQWAMRQVDDLLIEEGDEVRVQPCFSPIWDTAIATIALADAGLPDFHPALLRAVRWLLDKEVRNPGDWRVRRPGIEPGGWYFQYRNEFYPDVDDTAMVLLALKRTALADSPEVVAATERAVAWILAMQNRDGGWAAFDVDIDNQVLTKVPFADHNAMLDPSCADITARVLEVLGGLGYRADHPAVARALEYLWRTQEPQGCWYGRWGVNYIYGTWQVLLGLRAIEFPTDHPAARRAADWLESVQQGGGGWGESPRSYDEPDLMGRGTPTASQTAWAVLGLIAAGRGRSEVARRGVQFLVDTQNPDGTWDEDAFTGTGFPSVFYLKYHMYRVYFPLMALARYRAAGGRLQRETPGALASRVPALPRSLEV